ncbi:beta-lactamase/transpeptidase-like protein, partial [Pholiota conissans]
MKLAYGLSLLSILIAPYHALQVPMRPDDASQAIYASPHNAQGTLISERTEGYVHTLLEKWNSSGLSVAVVRKDVTAPNGWRHEFGAYGVAKADGSPMTPDSVFAIASNSKLFLAFSVGLLVSNKTLAKERGKEIKWSTKIKELIPEWGLMDEDMDRGVTLQDMLSHRTGMPRHDFSGVQREGGISEMISTLRYLRPSAEHRETFQYNNLMYETLSYLPQVLLNQ